MKIMHVDASARTRGSHSRELSAYFIDALRDLGSDIEIDRFDLAINPPRHFGALETAAVSIAEADHTPEMRAAIEPSDAIAARVLAADALVIGTPIYNFGMPSTLKAFFDHVSRNGKTFLADAKGMQGLLGAKKAAVLSSAGGAYSDGEMFEGLDCLTPHIRAILGFMGLTQVSFIAARPMMFAGPDAAQTSMKAAKDAANALARTWATA